MNKHELRYEDMKDEDFTPDEEVTIAESFDEIPHFASEEEATQWWDTHSLADNLWSRSRRGPPQRWAERAEAERERRKRAKARVDGTTLLQKATFITGDLEPKPNAGNSASAKLLATGVAVCGLLVAGLVLYELLRSKPVSGAFEPTGVPHLSVLHLGDTALKAVGATPRLKAVS